MVTTEPMLGSGGGAGAGQPGGGRTTVVIATRNRRSELLAHLHHHEAPVIVVDNASTDGTPRAVTAAFPSVRVIRLKSNRGAVARTIGVRGATTDYVAFADDDSWWAPGALAEAERLLDAHPGIGLLAASIAVGPDNRPDPVNAVLADSPLGPSPTGVGPRLLGFVGCAAVVRRTAFLAAGGFDPVVRFPGEEERLALDLAEAGWELVHAPGLWVHHHPSAHREPGETRKRDLVRSALLTALLRRDLADVADRVRTAWRSAARGRSALLRALPRVPAALVRRRPVSDRLVRQLDRLNGENAVFRPPVAASADTSTPPHQAVSVVMITHNRRPEALRALERVLALPERPAVYVVDNGSADGTVEAIRERFAAEPRLTLVASRQNLGAVGRNVAVDLVLTEFVAFCDDDTWWEPGALQAAVDALAAHPRLGVVTARILVEPGARQDPINAELLHSPVIGPDWLPGPALGSFLAGASVLRTRAFREVGGFSRRLWLGGEEELMAADLASAGWELCHLPHVLVHHQASKARDPHLRRRHGLRNTLWFTWLRRPLPVALRRSWHVLSTAPRDRITAAAVVDAVRGAVWVARERRVVPDHVEARFLALEESQRTSAARQYVS